ncbi:MAG: hypothetical protein RDV48_13865 [Candidatus Eremiobacteraeota bacterium]|nr:hypothetical protein [Candidatus Eremiobacteraeota bacterium]
MVNTTEESGLSGAEGCDGGHMSDEAAAEGARRQPRRTRRSINAEELIDIINISSESWETLDPGDVEPEKFDRLRNYYVDVAVYNRKLELVKQGYYDVFEEPDLRVFNDRLTLSLKSQLNLRELMVPQEPAPCPPEEALEAAPCPSEEASQEAPPEAPGSAGLLESIIGIFFPGKPSQVAPSIS